MLIGPHMATLLDIRQAGRRRETMWVVHGTGLLCLRIVNTARNFLRCADLKFPSLAGLVISRVDDPRLRVLEADHGDAELGGWARVGC